MVDAPRRSYGCLQIDPCWDKQDDGSSPLSHGHSFFFSAPTSPRMSQTLVQNNYLDLSSMPDSRFKVDDDSRHKQDNDGNDDDEEFEFEFISNVSKWDEPPCSPTLILNSSSWMLLPAPSLLKPPHLRKPHHLSVQEPSPACEKSNVGEGVQQQEKCLKEKKWRLKDFLSQSNGQKRLPIPCSRPCGQQGSISYSPSSDLGKKTMNGTAMRMKACPPSYPLPPPRPTPISSVPSSTRKSANTTPPPNKVIYRSTRAQLHNRQRKTPLPYHSGFLDWLGFASKCYIPIAEFSKGLQPAT